MRASPDAFTEGLNVTRGATAVGFTSSGGIANLPNGVKSAYGPGGVNNPEGVTSNISGTGSVSSSSIGSDTHEYIVNLTGVTNAQHVVVTLNTVQDSAGNLSLINSSGGFLPVPLCRTTKFVRIVVTGPEPAPGLRALDWLGRLTT
jgi:hypothetical protein